jgi:uncharacterized protein YdeI (YjbR/CyaY-like superfamily)
MKRPRYPISGDIKTALAASGVTAAYSKRPAYQQNDYVGGITRAKLPATRGERIVQMVAELKKVGVYMNMAHPGSAKTKR